MKDHDLPMKPLDRRVLLKGMSGAAAMTLVPAAKARKIAPTSSAAVKRHFSELKINTIIPGDPDYDTARAVWDARVDKRPLAVIECSSVEDVRQSLRYCRERGLKFAVRSGGHAFGGRSMIDGGVVLDLSRMNNVEVAADRQSVKVGPGVRTANLLGATIETGMVPVTTTGNHIGAIGAALFSGQGWLGRVHGNMCDNVRSIELVLPNGDLIKATPESHPDLFWALRGAGDNFGIVTTMEFALFPLPKAPTTCSITYKLEDAERIIKAYRDHAWQSPPPFVWATLYLDPVSNAPVLNYLFVLLGDKAENAGDLAEIAKFGAPLDRSVTEMSWLEVHDQLYIPPNTRVYLAQRELHDLDDDNIAMLLDEARKLATRADAPKAIDLRAPGAFIGFFPNTGAMAKQAVPPAVYGCRGGYDLEIMANWIDKAEDERHESWCRGVVNRFIDAGKTDKPAVIANTEISEKLTEESFKADFARLKAVKHVYDPHNLFGSTAIIG